MPAHGPKMFLGDLTPSG